MTTLHPWIHTAEAFAAAGQAVSIPYAKLPAWARRAGRDELFSQALEILTECATSPVARASECGQCGGDLTGVRKGAKYCSKKCRNQHHMDSARSKDGKIRPRGGASAVTLPDSPHTYVGSMHDWPEDKMPAYATGTVGLALCNWLRTQQAYSCELVTAVDFDWLALRAP